MAKKTAEDSAKATTFEQLRKILAAKSEDDTVLMTGESESIDVDAFPTGIVTLDKAFGCLGLPIGRIIEFFGSESSGKTTTALAMIAACQNHYFKDKNRNGRVLFIDAEHALDPDWARKVGVNIKELLILQPTHAEETFEMIKAATTSDYVDMIVIDSVAALAPKSQVMGSVEDQGMAELARVMSRGINAIKGLLNAHKVTALFINQIREKVGVVFGNNEVTPGGRALKFYATIRMQISKGSAIKEGEEVVGFSPKVKIIKNKVARPFTEAEYDITFGHSKRPVFGVDKYSSVLNMAGHYNIINVRGSHYSISDTVDDKVYSGLKLGAGRAAAINSLISQPEVYRFISEKVYAAMGAESGPVLSGSDSAEITSIEDVDDSEDLES